MTTHETDDYDYSFLEVFAPKPDPTIHEKWIGGHNPRARCGATRGIMREGVDGVDCEKCIRERELAPGRVAAAMWRAWTR